MPLTGNCWECEERKYFYVTAAIIFLFFYTCSKDYFPLNSFLHFENSTPFCSNFRLFAIGNNIIITHMHMNIQIVWIKYVNGHIVVKDIKYRA